MTLKKTWENCMSLWRHVYRRKMAGDERSVDELKTEWCKKHGFSGMSGNCFFCEYIEKTFPERECNEGCPGSLVDPEFSCEDRKYSYSHNPIAFYNKLRSLHRLYLKNLKKGGK